MTVVCSTETRLAHLSHKNAGLLKAAVIRNDTFKACKTILISFK